MTTITTTSSAATSATTATASTSSTSAATVPLPSASHNSLCLETTLRNAFLARNAHSGCEALFLQWALVQ